jgi:1-acyl-sn-glycerol-3-phosphate acyltransferase
MRVGDLSSLFLTAVFYTGYVLFSLVFIPMAALITTPAALLSSRRTALRFTRGFIRLYGILVARLAFPWVRIEVTNRSGLPRGTPCLFVSNHQSIADIFLMARLPKRECVFISNRWPLHLPVLGFFAKLAGYLNVETMGFEALLDRVRELFSDGVSIISFPEGTRTRTGEIRPFHTTVFRIAHRLGIPVVPICIAGNWRLMPPGQARLSPGTVRLHVLPAIGPETYANLTPHHLKRQARDLIARELAAIESGAPCR